MRMKQSIIPGVSLKNNERLTLEEHNDGWKYTLKVYPVQLGLLEAVFYMSDERVMSLRYPEPQFEYMIAKMRRDIEREVVRLVLG